jgi:hypothetical protein
VRTLWWQGTRFWALSPPLSPGAPHLACFSRDVGFHRSRPATSHNREDVPGATFEALFFVKFDKIRCFWVSGDINSRVCFISGELSGAGRRGSSASTVSRSAEKHSRGRAAEPQVPPLRSPGFPVENSGVDVFRAALFEESRIRGCCWQREVGNPGPLRSG